MSRFLIIVGLLGLTLSCNRNVPQFVAVHDSTKTNIRTEYIVKEVKLPPDSSTLLALLECDSLGRVLFSDLQTLQGVRTQLQATLANNQLKIRTTDKGVKTIEYALRDSIVYRTRDVPAPYPVEVNRVTRFQKIQIWIGRIALLLLVLYVVRKLK